MIKDNHIWNNKSFNYFNIVTRLKIYDWHPGDTFIFECIMSSWVSDLLSCFPLDDSLFPIHRHCHYFSFFEPSATADIRTRNVAFTVTVIKYLVIVPIVDSVFVLGVTHTQSNSKLTLPDELYTELTLYRQLNSSKNPGAFFGSVCNFTST